jgi:hypothetical protein
LPVFRFKEGTASSPFSMRSLFYSRQFPMYSSHVVGELPTN